MVPESNRCGFESLHIMNFSFVSMFNRIFEVKTELALPMLTLVMACNAKPERWVLGVW